MRYRSNPTLTSWIVGIGSALGGAALLYRTRPSKAPCVKWGEGQIAASLETSVVSESSGIARSSKGDWWTHNDSGGKASLFAFSTDGSFIGESPITGSNFVDWEGLSTGKCPSGSWGGKGCVYIADFGDNSEKRGSIQIYAVKEPQAGNSTEVLATWNVTYPDRSHNAEALLVSPKGEILIVTKETRGDAAFVFSVPSSPGDVTAEHVGSIPGFVGNRKITGGSWSANGKNIVLLTYGNAYIWKVQIGGKVNWEQPPIEVKLAETRKAEAIDFDTRGNLILTSEGNPMPIQVIKCTGRSLLYQGAWWGALGMYLGGAVWLWSHRL